MNHEDGAGQPDNRSDPDATSRVPTEQSGSLDTSVAGDPNDFYRVAEGFRAGDEVMQRVKAMKERGDALLEAGQRPAAVAVWRDIVQLLRDERTRMLRLRRETQEAFAKAKLFPKAGEASPGVFHHMDRRLGEMLRDAQHALFLLEHGDSPPPRPQFGTPNPLIRPSGSDAPRRPAGGGDA